MDERPADDPYRWLEEVDGERAMTWVLAQNAATEADLFVQPLFEELRAGALEVLEADDRIAYPSVHGDRVTNFWTDARHRRGLYRRSTWDDYLAGDPTWETVLDVDALSEAEGESWVLHGIDVRRPDRTRALVDLSPGGSDASTTREYDLVAKEFVADGFVRPVGKGGLEWIDDDTVYVATTLGPGTVTTSGYARQVREWRRGTRLEDAPVVFEVDEADMMASVSVGTLPGFRHHVFTRRTGFYSGETFVRHEGVLHRLDVPLDAEVGVRERWALVVLRSAWDGFAAGSLVAALLDDLLAGSPTWQAVFTPTASTSLQDWSATASGLVLQVLADVRPQALLATAVDDVWQTRPVEGGPQAWSVSASPVEKDDTDELWLTAEDWVTPPTLYRGPTPVRSSPARFDATGITVEQRFVPSADGTTVPYFVVGRGRPGPTLLDGYGGFEVPRLPAYGGVLGRSWLAAGGTYVLANIRGGGEYGPAWHAAGLRENRHRVYEDFEAVARDLRERGDATTLGCVGGSNGGLLVGNMYVRSPELFDAVVCQVPLLDMLRYPHLLAGASWMAEYGDPDTDDWDFIRTFSPYHLLDPAKDYPPILLTTSTKDDRVHPGHARKTAARLQELGKDVTYWENVEGGHGGAADAPQSAVKQALVYTFLRRHLMR